MPPDQHLEGPQYEEYQKGKADTRLKYLHPNPH